MRQQAPKHTQKSNGINFPTNKIVRDQDRVGDRVGDGLCESCIDAMLLK